MEGTFMKLWIGAGLILVGGIFIAGQLIQVQIERTKEDNSTALCVGGYTGENESLRDWRRLSQLSVEEASRETGIRESVIEDCRR
jgi:hypothetical protein